MGGEARHIASVLFERSVPFLKCDPCGASEAPMDDILKLSATPPSSRWEREVRTS
jgi:hypothetical protein